MKSNLHSLSRYRTEGNARGFGFVEFGEDNKFLDCIDASVPPDREVHIIMDNYGTHKTPLIRAWFAKRPRFHVHFTPTYGSRLNLVERWFAELTTKQIRRGVHRSVTELERAIGAFLDAHNARSTGRRENWRRNC